MLHCCKKRKMHPEKANRETTQRLTDLPNIGPALAKSLQLIGIDTPAALVGRDAYALYRRLCALTGKRQDPCVLDTFMSVTDFMNGGDPKVWWAYTKQRKALMDTKENYSPPKSP